MKNRPVRHKSDYVSPYDDFHSTRCGLWIFNSGNGRIAKTWRATTCGNCLRVGKRTRAKR